MLIVTNPVYSLRSVLRRFYSLSQYSKAVYPESLHIVPAFSTVSAMHRFYMPRFHPAVHNYSELSTIALPRMLKLWET